MPASPYRAPRPSEHSTCVRCNKPLPRQGGAYPTNEGKRLCEACFLGQFDLVTLFGIIAIGASTVTQSAVFLVGAVVVQGLAAYAIYHNGI